MEYLIKNMSRVKLNNFLHKKGIEMDPGSDFNFQHLLNFKFPCLEKTEVKQNLTKWSMIDGLRLQAYSFDKPFKKYNERDFLMNFFGCQNVSTTFLKSSSPAHQFSQLGIPADAIKFSEVTCSLTTLEMFDKLKIGGKIVRENGVIVKCMPNYIRAEINDDEKAEGFEIEIADNLRKILFSNQDDSDDFDEVSDGVLTELDKKEFLFSLFSHLVLGGSLCQYEDIIEPYLLTTKLLYKDLIAVALSAQNNKDADGPNRNINHGSMASRPSAYEGGGGDAGDKHLKIISHVYKIHSASNDSSQVEKKNLLFNHNYLNNFLYVIVNPLKQICFTLYHHV